MRKISKADKVQSSIFDFGEEYLTNEEKKQIDDQLKLNIYHMKII